MKSNAYYKLLDEIRLSKSMTVSSLCENIISERTYYRLLKSNKDLRVDVYSKLADRLGTTTPEIIYFSTFIRKGDPQISRFVYRVHTHYFFDIDPIYEAVQNYQFEDNLMQYTVEAYICKYRNLKHEVDDIEYKNSIKSIMQNVKELKLENIYAYCVYALYATEFPEDENNSLVKVLDKLVSMDFNMGLLFYLISLDLLMDKLIDTKTNDLSFFSKALSRYTQTIQHFPNKNFHMKYLLYSAYDAYKRNHSDYELYLTKYMINVYILKDGDFIQNELNRISQIFSIHAKELVALKTKEFLQTKPFFVESSLK